MREGSSATSLPSSPPPLFRDRMGQGGVGVPIPPLPSPRPRFHGFRRYVAVHSDGSIAGWLPPLTDASSTGMSIAFWCSSSSFAHPCFLVVPASCLVVGGQ